MENTKIEKKDAMVMALNVIDSIAMGALIGRVVVCFMPKSTKVAINLVLGTVYAALGSKLADIVMGMIADDLHMLNENVVDSVGDLIDAFKAAKTQKKEA